MLRQIWNWVLVVFRRRTHTATAAGEAARTDVHQTVGTTVSVRPPPPPAEEKKHAYSSDGGNRKWRRRDEAERRRRKLDKFVTPKGPEPVKIPRAPTPRAARAADTRPDLVQGYWPKEGDGTYLMQGDDGTVYREHEIYGEFNFRDTILDQLERYWVYLKRMKLRDKDSFELYSKFGAKVVPPATFLLQDGWRKSEEDKDKFVDKHLSAWWKSHRPSFGCITYGMTKRIEDDELTAIPDDKDKSLKLWIPKFLYFVKYKCPPPEVQLMSGGDIYKMTVWWDKPQDKSKWGKAQKGGRPDEFAVFISADGETIKILKLLKTEMVEVPSKRNGLDKFRIPKTAWAFPEHHCSSAKDEGLTVQQYLIHLFCQATYAYERTNYSMLRIAVMNGNLTAVFSVDPRRMAYFFQDRDITLTEHGVKKKIFHMVRPHERVVGGNKKHVKLHFRGLREFEWAGYRVRITVPGRDHFLPDEMDIGVYDEYWVDPKDRGDFLSEGQMADMLVHAIEEGVGAIK